MDKVMAQLEGLVAHYEELQEMMADPEVINDTKRYMEISKEEADLREVVQKYKKYKEDKKEIEDNKEIISSETDPDLIEMAKEENSEIEKEIPELEDQIKILMLPKDPNDDKDIIMEIRGAAGGDEASLFAGDLLRMYEKYAERQNWKVSMIDSEPTEVGCYKRVAIMITGDKVYSKLKYENGAHRVQRIPVTESQGRVHTSTATVAVMPEYEQVDIDIDPKDIRVDVYRSSGAGGQHINKTSSAVRMTHLPTGIVVAMQDQRSQQQNREKAMQILKSRVYDYYESQNQAQYDAKRKNAVGTGDRSERIRTYNYPQNRVTDHRIGLTINKLDRVMNGELELKQEMDLTADQIKQANKDIEKLAKGISPQYILGYAWFLGYKIMVQRGVLIPRFETEELVEWALQTLKSGDQVLDLGTGSGCITVALAKEAQKKGITDLTLYASDVTDTALRTSEENFLTYDLDVTTRKANVLLGLEKFDKIISNPPYIKTSEKNVMDENVLQNEPKEALFAGKDGLDFYKKFAKQVREHLNSHGEFFLEFGFSEEEQLKELFAKELPDFEIEFRKDMAGKPRMVHGRWQK